MSDEKLKIDINEIIHARNLLKNEGNQKFADCVGRIISIGDYYYPAIRKRYGNEFEERIFMTLYMEMIHTGFV